jgi:hypothetical protein
MDELVDEAFDDDCMFVGDVALGSGPPVGEMRDEDE